MEDRNLASYNHGEALLIYLHQLQQQHRFTDVLIQCDGKLISLCHRLILAAFSGHFEAALVGIGSSAQITLDIDPKITGVSVDDLKLIIEFFYTGRVQPTNTLYKSAIALGATTLASVLESSTSELAEDPDHGIHLLQACRRFHLENRFTDVSIHCQTEYMMTCHRLVLSAYSDHFEMALIGTENCPQVTLDINPDLTGVTANDLKLIIDFMYDGVVRVARRRVKSLAAAGRALGVTKLNEILNVHEQKYIGHVGGQQMVSSAPFGPGSAIVSPGHSGADQLSAVQFVSLGSDAENYNVVETVAATEDVVGGDTIIGIGDSVPEPDVGAETLMIEGVSVEETTGEDPDEIYEEFVSGPRRRKNPMGTHRGQIKIKSREYKRRPGANDESDHMNLFIEESQLEAERRDLSTFVGETEPDVTAITLTMVAPLAKRRRTYSSDTFGYGLPEIVATADVTVPLLVGDQQLMMEKPFKCPYCDHRTKEKSALEKHIRCIHTLETPYKCRYCNQAFKVQSNLVRHIRAHTGEKPYVCKKCGAAYADKKNMDAHVFREHLKLKPYECPSAGCTAKFWRQDRFNYHCRRQHGLEPTEGVN